MSMQGPERRRTLGDALAKVRTQRRPRVFNGGSGRSRVRVEGEKRRAVRQYVVMHT